MSLAYWLGVATPFAVALAYFIAACAYYWTSATLTLAGWFLSWGPRVRDYSFAYGEVKTLWKFGSLRYRTYRHGGSFRSHFLEVGKTVDEREERFKGHWWQGVAIGRKRTLEP